MPPPNKRVTFEPSLIFVETPSSLPILDSPSDQGLRHDDIVLKSHVTTKILDAFKLKEGRVLTGASEISAPYYTVHIKV